MERPKIIDDLKEWRGKDEENRAFILILAEKSNEDLDTRISYQGNNSIICASLAGTIIEQSELFRDALRIISPSIFK